MKKSMSKRTRILIQAAVLVIVVAVAAIVITTARSANSPDIEGTPQTLRENSHRLDTAEDGKVTLVEFLDFECEACAAAYPLVESLREDYAGRVTFATRYFPIPSHQNAQNSAVAAEAAARQGQFEAMYTRLFETQTQWGEQASSRAEFFRFLADEIGLDMEQYDADVADPDVLERVLADQREGTALGVEGTPTFFLNGEKLEVSSVEEFRAAIEEAVQE